MILTAFKPLIDCILSEEYIIQRCFAPSLGWDVSGSGCTVDFLATAVTVGKGNAGEALH